MWVTSSLRSSLPVGHVDRIVVETMTTSPAVAHRLATGPGGNAALVEALYSAFIEAMHRTALARAAAAFAGAVIAHLLLGRR